MSLPIALHFAFNDTHKHALVRWYPILVIALAIPITISRSAIVAVAIVLLFLMPTWPRARQWTAGVLIVGLMAAVYVAIPGMLGTIIRLFSGIGEDGSALSRTDSYAIAFDFFLRNPVFGRGFSTFLPQYRILDNQYLGLLIEIGIVGTIALVVLFFVAIATALSRRHRTTDERARSLALSLAAMAAAGACSFATFDALGFPQVAGLMFLSIGLIGGLSNTIARRAHVLTPQDRVRFRE
nr:MULTISPECIES: O-antigen ligase family protein [unclassified Cryobacterium]